MTGRPPPRPTGGTARLTAESALLGLLVGVAVVAPWTRSGHLLLLDWVTGPNQSAPAGLYGLDPTALDALPYRLATHAVRQALGPGVTGWLLVLLYFPLAAGGVSALAGGGRRRRHPAALFAVCNPFVLHRLSAGHVAFLLATALLAWLLAAAVRARGTGRCLTARPAAWYALAMAVSPHAAWLGGAGLLAVALLPRPRRADLIRTAVTVPAAAGVYAYAFTLLPGPSSVGPQHLDAYASRPGPGGLLPALAALQGFWRTDPDRLAAWVLPPVLLVIVAAGLIRLARRDPERAAPLAVLAVAGLFLGAGVRGPLAGIYRAAFEAVPLFAVMREQQKWVALTMLAYAVALGVTVEALMRRRALAGLAVLGAVCGLTAPSLVWGLGGTVRPSHYPSGWHTADRLMGDGAEAVLFLPWHAYQPFGFTGSRTVATPAGAFFRRPVLSGGAVELGAVRTDAVSRRAAYLDRLVAAGGGGRFGRLVAPLGVRYVALARGPEAAAYGWLARQTDLRLVLRTVDLDLYLVEADGTGRVVASRTGDHDDAADLAGRGELGTEAVLPGGPARGTVPSAAHGGLRRTGPTSWRVAPGTAGWVVLPEEWSPDWVATGPDPGSAARVGRPTVAGTVAIEAGPGALTVEYTAWRRLRVGLAVSLVALAALLLAALLEPRLAPRTVSSARRPP